MKAYTRALLSMLLLVAASGWTAEAQIVKKAQVGFRFLENPVSAEVIGRGEVGVATTRNADGLFWNPALIAWTSGMGDVSLHHTEGIADINYNAAAAAVHLWDAGVLGASAMFMDYGTFYGTRIADNPEGYEETGEFSPKSFVVGLAFAQKVSDRFSFGVQLKYVSQDLGRAWVSVAGKSITDPNLVIASLRYKKYDYALDVGAYYDFLYNGIRFGATLQNISREIKYESEAFPMPFAVSFGVTVEPLQFFMEGHDAQALVLSVESRHPRDFEEKLKFGAEYTVFDVLTGRIGYMKNLDERGFTAGIGVKQDLSGVPIRADYAYQAFGLFGAVHHLSVGFGF